MIYTLSENFINRIHSDSLETEHIELLNRLYYPIRDGSIVFYTDKITLRCLTKIMLNKETIEVFRTLKDELSDIKSLYNYSKVISEISDEDSSTLLSSKERYSNNKMVLTIPIDYFPDSRFLTSSSIICEGVDDYKFYMKVTDFFIEKAFNIKPKVS